MKLKVLSEARYASKSGSVRVCVDITRDLVQEYTEYYDDDFDETLNHLVELVKQVLGDQQYVIDSFDF